MLTGSKRRTLFRRTIIVGFAVLLPVGWLAYFGFRSFDYEEQLLRKSERERLDTLATHLSSGIEDHLSGLITALGTPPADQTVPEMTEQLFNRTTPSQGRVFAFDGAHARVAPRAYGPALSAPALDWGVAADTIKRLEHLEHIEKDFRGALRGYAELLPRLPSDVQRAAVLKRLAHNARRMGDDAAAEQYLLRLERQFEMLPDPVGYPTGIVAAELRARLHEKAGRLEKSGAIRLQLRRDLALGRWALSRDQDLPLQAQQDAWFRDQAATLRLDPDFYQRWHAAGELARRMAAYRAAADQFSSRLWPQAVERLQSRGWSDSGGIICLNDSACILASPVVTQAQGGKRRWASVLPREKLLETLNGRLVDLSKAAGIEAEWITGTGETLDAAGSHAIDKTILAIDPPLKVRVRADPSANVPGGGLRRRVVFGILIGLSLLALGAGLLALLHALRREVQMAELKSEFVANVSHELRTPLATISLIGERLRRGRFKNEEQLSRMFTLLGEETGRLQGLIDEVLDFSRSGHGVTSFRKEPVDLRALVTEAVEHVDGKRERYGKEVALKLEQTPVVPVDRRAFLRAVTNLLDNAFKYSGDAKTVTVELKSDDGGAVVSVADGGIGIAPEHQARIFDRFFRVEYTLTRKSEGVGLGLPMVKQIMEGHGGRITVRSRVGEGSRFSLWFPGALT
jgi:signal transduction histidine kinase